MNRSEAAVLYGISSDTARSYMRMYRDADGLAPKSPGNGRRVSAV